MDKVFFIGACYFTVNFTVNYGLTEKIPER